MTPIFQVSVGDKDITALVQKRLVSLKIHDSVERASCSLELTLDNRDGAVKVPSFGANLAASIGYQETGLVSKGKWRVDEFELEGPEQRLLIRARSADTNSPNKLSAIKALQTRSWLQADGRTAMTLGQIAAKMAAESNLALKIDPVIAAAIPSHTSQVNESDLSFLMREVTIKPNGSVVLQNNCLMILQTGKGTSVTGAPMVTIAVLLTDATRWRSLLTRRSSHKRVRARFVTPSGPTQYVEAVSPDATDEDSATELQEDFDAHDIAQDAAQAKLNSLGRGAESVSLTLVGNPQISIETKILLQGFNPTVDRVWTVAEASHHLDTQGYITEVEAVKSL